MMNQKNNKPIKTKKAMKKTMRFLSIAALAFMGAIIISCSKENNVPKQGNVVKLTATVGLDGGATKALTSDGVKTFAVGDQIAVVYKNTSSVTVKALSAALTAGDITGSGKTANFNVTLTDPDNTQNVTYIYPAAMANADGSINYDALNSQDGLLTSLASNLDLATYTGPWSGTSLPTATLDNPLAILAITLKNSDGSEEITGNTTSMTVSDGTNSYTVTRAAAAGPIYVAIRPTASADIEITATGGPLLYSKNLSTKTIAANNGYNVSWRMARIGINLAGVTENTTAIDGDIITGILDVEHYPVKISIADGATVTLAGVTIEGVNNDDYEWAGINCIGDATIILADGTTNTVKGFYEDFPGIWARLNHTLTINGTGSLVASSNGWGAGIGGGCMTTFGDIRIEGGNITATGGNNCAGIGAGGWGSGNITITGGHINATGNGGGAGIGGGYGNNAVCGDITISGGTIIANGGEDGAGIGTGNEGTCGDITISGGTITANGGERGAGIGAGNGGTCGDITIGGSSTNITANGGEDGAGIGIGYDAECGNISISGGTIEAAGNRDGAGIGCSGYGECGNIGITSGVTLVTATKGARASHSIGFNTVYTSGITCGAVTIGGTVYYDGTDYQNGGDAYLSASPFIYPAL